MTVTELIEKLSRLPGDTVVVSHHRLGDKNAYGYDDNYRLEGTHTTGGRALLIPRRAARVVGKAQPDWEIAPAGSRSKRKTKFVVIGL